MADHDLEQRAHTAALIARAALRGTQHYRVLAGGSARYATGSAEDCGHDRLARQRLERTDLVGGEDRIRAGVGRQGAPV